MTRVIPAIRLTERLAPGVAIARTTPKAAAFRAPRTLAPAFARASCPGQRPPVSTFAARATTSARSCWARPIASNPSRTRAREPRRTRGGHPAEARAQRAESETSIATLQSRALRLAADSEPSRRVVDPETELGQIRERGVAVVGGDVEPVVAIRRGAGHGVGVQLVAPSEGLVALRVERVPAGAVVGALELPVFRIARGKVVRAGDRVALDGLRCAEVVAQPTRDGRIEPLCAGVSVEGVCGIGRAVGAVVGGA